MTPCKVLQMLNKSELSSLVPILDGLNYDTWHKSMKAYLMSLRLWGHCTGSITAPLEPDNPEKDKSKTASSADIELYKKDKADFDIGYAAWSKDDEKALGSILLRCHRHVGHNSKQTSLDVFRPLSVRNRVLCSRQEERQQDDDIDVPRTGDSTWSLRDSKW